MSRQLARFLFLGSALGILAGPTCGGGEEDSGSQGQDLQWYATCGDPVCSGYGGPFDGVPLCSDEGVVVGDTCGEADASCDPEDGCNALLTCTNEDPTQQTGGCPISLAEHKTEIRYLTPEQRESARTALLEMRLATWQYRGDLDDGATHLGFLIDDVGAQSPAVRPDGGHVDLYGYTSLAVAAIQQQQAELEALRKEVQALREVCDPAKPGG